MLANNNDAQSKQNMNKSHSQNMLSIEPRTLNFKFSQLNKQVSQTFIISNSSPYKTRLQILDMDAKDFKVSPIKRGNFFSGESQTITVSFTPINWGIKTGHLIITCAAPETHGTSKSFPERIEISAFPYPVFDIPKLINFGSLQVSRRKTTHVKLDNPLGFPIEYFIHIDSEQPEKSFLVEPMKGKLGLILIR